MSDHWKVYTFKDGVLTPSGDRTRSDAAIANRRTYFFAGSDKTWNLAVDLPRLIVRTTDDHIQIFIHDELVDESPGRHGSP